MDGRPSASILSMWLFLLRKEITVKTSVLSILALAVGLIVGWWLHPRQGPVRTGPTGPPTIEKIRSLANLAVLSVPISDVQVQELSGYTGSVRLILIVKGDVEVGSDLGQTRWTAIDAQQRRATLVLATPVASRPRLDHERTRIFRLEKEGLWKLVPGDGTEAALVDKALLEAQRVVAEASQQPELIEQAKQHCQAVLSRFLAALDWQVLIKWADRPTPVPVATQPIGDQP